MRQYLVGIDGGASRSRAILVDNCEKVASSAEGAGLNPLSVGWDNFRTHFRDLLLQVLRPNQPDKVRALCAGLAGVGSDAVRNGAREAIVALMPGVEIHVITDAQAALWGAFQGGPGLLLIAGTGSICIGMNAQAGMARSGGFGRLLGDEGSGYWIAREAVKEALKRADRGVNESSLAPLICRQYGLKDILDVIALFHSSQMSADRIARLAEKILAISNSDRTAQGIIRHAGEHLAVLTINTAKKLRLEAPRVALWGGLWNSPGKELQRQLETALLKKRFDGKIVSPAQPPEWGAIHYLRKRLA